MMPSTAIERFLEVNKEDRVFGLDLLRTIAIMLVVLGHGEFILEKNFGFYPSVAFIDGVDIFFILSGFLIGGILLKELNKEEEHFNILNFWKRRWYRTLPNYFLVLSLLIVVNVLVLKNSQFRPYVWKYFLFLQNFLYPCGRFFPESWSLSVEEWFYLLLPVLCVVFITIGRRSPRSLMYAALILIVISLLYKVYKSFQFPAAFMVYDMYFRKVVAARLDSLAIGVIGAYWAFTNKPKFYSYRYLKLMAGVVLIGVSLALPFNQVKMVVNSLVFSSGMLLCLPFFASLKKYPTYTGAAVLYISVVSYSLYLFHFSIVLWLLVGVNFYYSWIGAISHYMLYLVLSFAISTFNYKYFELYFLKRR